MPSLPWGQWTGEIPTESAEAPAPSNYSYWWYPWLAFNGHTSVGHAGFANPYVASVYAAWIAAQQQAAAAAAAAASRENDEEEGEGEEENEEDQRNQLFKNDKIDPSGKGFFAAATPKDREPGLGLHGISLFLPSGTNYLFPQEHALIHVFPDYADPTTPGSWPEWYARYSYGILAAGGSNGSTTRITSFKFRKYCVPTSMTVRELLEQLLIADGSSDQRKSGGVQVLKRTAKKTEGGGNNSNDADRWNWKKGDKILWKTSSAKKSLKENGLHHGADGSACVFLLCVGQR